MNNYLRKEIWSEAQFQQLSTSIKAQYLILEIKMKISKHRLYLIFIFVKIEASVHGKCFIPEEN